MGVSEGAVGPRPCAYHWYRDGAAIMNASNSAFTIQSSALSDVGTYQVVVTNGFGAVTSAVATLTIVDQSVPDSFNPGASGEVYSFALQPDGKVLAGGAFTTLGGQTRTRLGRLNKDGSLDVSFNPGADNNVYALGVQADGRIVVGGGFGTLGGQACSYLGRLNVDGSLDTSFTSGANSTVYSLAVQADGKLLVGGDFTNLCGQPRNYLGRLNADGGLDTTFNPGAGSPVYSLAVQPDGKILAGGAFTTLGGTNRSYLGRLNTDGSVDATFNPGAGSVVLAFALQTDGKILVGGFFNTLGGQTRNYLGRLNADGSLDTGFNTGAGGLPFRTVVNCLALQANGKILVGGWFWSLGGLTRYYLGRLNTDGGVDMTFNPGTDGNVDALAVQSDGSILVGGKFTTLGGQTRNCLGRLNNTGPAAESLTFTDSTVVWLRSGTGPEVWRTTFDASTNGTDWISLGMGTRIPGGWTQSGLALPSNATIRARGHVTGGWENGSAWFVETGVGPGSTAERR